MTRFWIRWVSSSVFFGFLFSVLKSWVSSEGLGTTGAVIALLMGVLVARDPNEKISFKTEMGALHQSAGELLLFTFIFVMSLLSFTSLWGFSGSEWGVSNPDNLGDLPFHLHLIQYFAKGAVPPFQNPILSGTGLSYPFGIDFWDSLWVRSGVPVGTCLLVTGALGLWASATQLTRMGGLLFLVAFFWSGGLAASANWQDTFGPSAPLPWKNLFYSVFVTQRGFLFALPAGLFLVNEWSAYFEGHRKSLSKTVFWIWSILPLFHLHTFAILSLWILLQTIFYRKFEKKWLVWGVLPLVWMSVLGAFEKASGSIGFQPGWMIDSWSALIYNFGPWLVVPVGLVWKWVVDKKWQQGVTLVLLVVFVFTIKIAPWEWDQIKVILWVYLLVTLAWIRAWRFGLLGQSLVLILVFWPGLLQWSSGWPSRTGFFGVRQAAAEQQVEFLLQSVPPSEPILARVDHRHPLLGSGHLLYLGSPGHVWSQGANATDREKRVKYLVDQDSSQLDFPDDRGFEWILVNDNPVESEGAHPERYARWGFRLARKVGPWQLWQREQSP